MNNHHYSIEYRTPGKCTAWLTIDAVSFIEATTKFMAAHPTCQILAIAIQEVV